MSLTVYLSEVREVDIYDRNITHNLGPMAKSAGIYEHLWHPYRLNITIAEELIQPLEEGLNKLKSDPEYYKLFNPSNDWGSYESFVSFVDGYLNACKQNPKAKVSVCN